MFFGPYQYAMKNLSFCIGHSSCSLGQTLIISGLGPRGYSIFGQDEAVSAQLSAARSARPALEFEC